MAEVQVAADNNAATATAEWECSVCTYKNTDISSDFCVMCESPRPNISPKNKNSSLSRLEGSGALDEHEDIGDDDDYDGSVNAVDALNGSNGENPRDAACMMSFANWNQDDFVAWKCVSCTFLNENPLFLKCEMCGQNRPRAGINADDNDDEDFEKKQQRFQQQDEMLLALERGKEIQAEQGFLFANANDEDDEDEPDLFA